MVGILSVYRLPNHIKFQTIYTVIDDASTIVIFKLKNYVTWYKIIKTYPKYHYIFIHITWDNINHSYNVGFQSKLSFVFEEFQSTIKWLLLLDVLHLDVSMGMVWIRWKYFYYHINLKLFLSISYSYPLKLVLPIPYL
jgi:hypothetical protein